MPKESIKQLVKRLNKSTLIVKKRGKKYCVKDAVEDFDGHFTTLLLSLMTRDTQEGSRFQGTGLRALGAG